KSERKISQRQTSASRIGCSRTHLRLSGALTGCSAVIETWVSGSGIPQTGATRSCPFIMGGDLPMAGHIRWRSIVHTAAAVATRTATRSGRIRIQRQQEVTAAATLRAAIVALLWLPRNPEFEMSNRPVEACANRISRQTWADRIDPSTNL